MNFLRLLTPINLQEEKERFFADNSYNPQFQYAGEIEEEKLLAYGKPKESYLQLAQNILTKAFSHATETTLEKSEGALLTQAVIEKKITTFLTMHDLEKRFSLSWSKAYISRTTISQDTLRLRLPAVFRQEGLLGMLYHEIGTHALRRINYEQQPWYKKKKKYGFSEYLYTEEGLASLHGLLPKTNKLAYKQARLYLGVELAQKHSFAETWQLLGPYITTQEALWTVVSRLKRGLTDTSNPGGYTKDLVYFEGFVDTWRWLAQHNFDCTELYYGKIAASDTEKAKALYEQILFNHEDSIYFIDARKKFRQLRGDANL